MSHAQPGALHCLGGIPWLRPFRQIRTEDVGTPRNRLAYLRFVGELHPGDIRFGFLYRELTHDRVTDMGKPGFASYAAVHRDIATGRIDGKDQFFVFVPDGEGVFRGIQLDQPPGKIEFSGLSALPFVRQTST